MTDSTALLQRLGFTEYEAKAYITLLQHRELTGYEVARLSGIPRPNVYAVLPKLEERGAVVRVDTPTGPRYAAVPVAELTQMMEDRFQRELQAARSGLVEIAAPAEREYVWNAQGYSALVEHARTLIDVTTTDLVIAQWPQEARELAGSLAAAEQRGVKITTLCLAACRQECGGCRGRIFRYGVAPEQQARWFVAVSDGAEMLSAQIGPGQEAGLVGTRQRLLVELAAWYIRHSIGLATIVGELGDRLPTLLSPDALESLSAIGPALSGGWLEYMEQAVKRSPAN